MVLFFSHSVDAQFIFFAPVIYGNVQDVQLDMYCDGFSMTRRKFAVLHELAN